MKNQLKDDKELPLKWLWSVTEMRLQQSREDKSPRCVEAIVAVLKQFSTFADRDVVVSSPCLSRHHHHLHATTLQHLANLVVGRATGTTSLYVHTYRSSYMPTNVHTACVKGLLQLQINYEITSTKVFSSLKD